MTDKPETLDQIKALGEIKLAAWKPVYDQHVFAGSSYSDAEKHADIAAAQAVSAAVREHAFREGAEWMKERAAKAARRLTDDETRQALGGNAVITAVQIEKAIRALEIEREAP